MLMYQAWDRRQVHTEFLLENLEEGNVDRMMMIIMVVVMLMTTEWTLKKQSGKVWNGFIYFRTATSVGHLSMSS